MIMWIWIAVIILAVVIEMAGPQLVSIWFAIGGAVALIAYLFGAELWLQIILFVIVTLIALILTRPLIAKFNKRENIPTNADRYIGMEGIVTDEINGILGTGRVNVKGNSWSAVASRDDEKIKQGTKVRVKAIDGVKLLVEPLNK